MALLDFRLIANESIKMRKDLLSKLKLQFFSVVSRNKGIRSECAGAASHFGTQVIAELIGTQGSLKGGGKPIAIL